MNLQINAVNLELTRNMIESLEKCISKFKDFIDPEKPVQVKIEEIKLKYRLEILFSYKKMLIKADVKDTNFNRVLRKAVYKINKKLKKIEFKHSVQISMEYGRLSNFSNKDNNMTKTLITRRKKFLIEPMTEEEALLQMELLGHEFLMFYNKNIQKMCLIYKRKEGNYGIIEAQTI